MHGHKDLPALPKAQLDICNTKREFVSSHVEFEAYRKVAVDSINQKMAKLRRNALAAYSIQKINKYNVLYYNDT